MKEDQNNNELEILTIDSDDEPTQEEIEIIDLDEPHSNNELTVLTSKKEGIIIIAIVLVLTIVTVFLIPSISKLFSGQKGYELSNEQNEIKNNGTIDGFLEIGNTEGSITAKKIQFYSFMKKTGNVLKFKYLPETTIKNTDNLNIYIELYNSKKSVIYRTLFTPASRIERKIIENVDLPLNENIYGEATYAKIVILNEKSFAISDNSMTCTLNDVNDVYTLNSTIVYNFSTNGLTEYKVKKSLIMNPSYQHKEAEETNPSGLLKKEGEALSKIGLETLEYTDSEITYTVDLLKNTIEGANYTLGNTLRQIKLDSEKNKWRCE